jgi:Tol biopolymer transport system component
LPCIRQRTPDLKVWAGPPILPGMNRPLLIASLLALLVTLAVPAAASAAPKPKQGTAIVFQRGFDVMYWDSFNGLRRVDRGDEPAISSNGRYVTYQRRGGAGCGRVIVRDLRTDRELPLPGIQTNSCVTDPHLSGDGHYVVFSSDSTVSGDPSAIYLYDTVAKRMLNLPAPVQSGSSEDSPSLSDDGRILSFVSGRNTLAFDDIFVADLSALESTGTVSLLPTPGLVTNGPQSDAVMSGNGSLIAFETGRTLERDVQLYSRSEGRMLNAPALSAGLDTYDPAPTPNGGSVLVANQVKDLGDRSVYRFGVGSGSFARLGALKSSLTDEHPSIAEPVELVDRTAPVVKLRCKRAGGGKLRCTIRSNERATARVTLKVGGGKVKKKLGLKPGRNKRFTLRSRAGRGKLSAAVSDPSGNTARKRARVRIS